MPAPTPLPTHLYKILPSSPPTPLPTALPLSDLDRNDGFIHLSTSSQFSGTAAKFFASATELYLLRIPYEKLASGVDGDGAEGKGEVKWEEVGRGCFAHYYGADLGRESVDAVLRVVREGDGDGEEAWVRAFENAKEV